MRRIDPPRVTVPIKQQGLLPKPIKIDIIPTVPAVGNFLLIYICNFQVLSDLLIIYTCKLHWKLHQNLCVFAQTVKVIKIS